MLKPEKAEEFFVESQFRKSMEKISLPCPNKFNVEKLTGDASTRRYYRINCDKESYVVCLDQPTDEAEENNFTITQKVLNENEINVPIIHDKNLKKGYLLEEDLGNVTLLNKLSEIKTRDEEITIYKKVLDELIKLHKISHKTIEDQFFYKQKFDYEKLMFEIEFSNKYFIQEFLKCTLTTEEEKILKNGFNRLCKELEKPETVLTHRDFHSRNLMFKDNKYIMIDFQDARMGIPQYDLVSLLEDNYYSLTYESKEELKNYYLEQMRDVIKDQSKSDFDKMYYYMKIQRTYKAIGSFAYIYSKREDIRYIKYIGYSWEKLKRVLLRNEEFSELREVLARKYYGA